ncbi:hypothetical protein F5X68DRAFT_265450 [Plectosphaerella plurivora]|uniref:Uncharacterized protein n=1 Tax=Plectosphaerella plurivora TaxID=936078 RepID=A0A9P8V361_9PEZI|nr:hypothetical protein F5X68DRAFT_265450 [Plectosphaerella plurivora]
MDQPHRNMPVSILCFMELMGPTIPDGFLDTLDQLFTSQDEVVAQYIDSYNAPPSLASHRGLTLYQQTEDPRIILGSGQWPSSAVCAEWFTKQAPAFMRELEGLHKAEAMETALVDGFIFSDIDSGAPTPLFDAPRIELTRWRVAAAQGERFDKAIDALAGKKREYFLLVNRDTVDGGGSAEEVLCKELATSVEKKTYSKAV